MESNSVTPFLSKTYDMVDDPSTNSVVSWSNSDNSFVVWNVPEFQKELLPKYFKHNNFSSFVRQLNTYGFRKVDPDRFEFANEGFLRGQKRLLKSISRKKHLHHVQNNQAPQVAVASCVEVGKFGLEEEVERLKRDKNVLMQELVKLRQQQQSTDNQLQTVGQRVQMMEQRQQQMMSFLAKAMHSPGFLNQLVQQKNDSNRHIAGGTRKRRLPRQEEENLAPPMPVGDDSSNGQIVKFHSSMNEAAKAMLHQILKMNSSYRLENSGPLLINNLVSNGLDSNSGSSRISELMFSEVPSASEPSFLPIESGFSANHPSNVLSEVESPSLAVPDNVETDHIAEMKVDNTAQDPSFPPLPGTHGFIPESSFGTPNVNFVASQTENAGNMNLMSSVLDVEMPVEAESFSPDGDRDVLVDGISKLPGITDAFWEQFLTASPLRGDSDEFHSSSPESSMTREQESQNGWNNIQTMNHLTEQMELLTSERGV